jgi:hypothetical protein
MHKGFTDERRAHIISFLCCLRSRRKAKFFKNQTTDRCRCLLRWRWWWVVVPKSKGRLLIQAERFGLSSEGGSQELREGSAAAGC